MVNAIPQILATKNTGSRGRFRIRLGYVWDPFGICSGSVRGPFGPISDQNFWNQKFLISEILDLCGRRHRGGGPLAAVPSPAAPEGSHRGGDGCTN